MRNPPFLALFVLPVAIVLTPAFSPASIYSWQDDSGVTTYSNVPPAMPVNAQITVRTSETVPTEPSEMAGVELVSAVQPQSPERSPYMATQAEFAVQLVKELGLGQPADAGQAADVLTNLRITPPLGEWIFDQPMTPELTIRLRQLTVAAAGRGEITITPEQALLAFDTAAALLNVDIPASADQDTISYAPYPIADLPPLVDFYQPAPVFYPYYIWTPVYGGFWWGYSYFPGYWVLNVSLFCNHYPNHYYYGHSYYNYYNHDGYQRHYPATRARFTSIDPGHISHHVRGHIEDHALRSRPAYDSARVISSPGQRQIPYASMRSGRTGNRASQPVSSPRSSFVRPMPARPMIDRRTPTVYNATAPRSTRSMNRSAFPEASHRRINSAGVPPVRSAVRGSMGGGTVGMRTTGYSLSGRRTLAGGQPHRSSGGVRAGSAFPGSSSPRSSFPSSSFHR